MRCRDKQVHEDDDERTKLVEVLQMCSLMETKVPTMSEVGIVIVPTKSQPQQRFKCRYSENVIHWELEHVKC